MQLYTYYTQLAGMYIGYDRYMKALRSQTEVGTRSSSHISVATALQAKTTIKTSSTAEMRTKAFTHDPKRYTRSEPIYIYSRSDERLRLVLDNLPGNFNQLNPNAQRNLLAPYADGARRGMLPFTDGKITEVENGGVTIGFSAFAGHPSVSAIENEGRVVARDTQGNYREFIIRVIEDEYGSAGKFKRVEAEGSEYELIDEWLPSYRQSSVTLPTALSAILQGTRWEVGEIEDKYTPQPVDLRHMTKRRAVNELINLFDGIVSYRVEIDGNRVVRRYVDVAKNSRLYIGKRFEAGKDILSASRTLDSQGIKTAMYGVGASDENGNRLTFSDVEWRKEWGDPVDKPLGQSWVGDPDALERWGAQGGTKHKTGGYDGQEEDPAELLLNTWNHLQMNNSLLDSYETDVINLGELLDYPHEKIKLSDNVKALVHDMHPPLKTDARIVEYIHNLNDRKLSRCVIGNHTASIDLNERVSQIEDDYNDKRGEWDKKPDKVKSELEEHIAEELAEANENIENAKKELEEAIENIEIGREDIEGLDEDLRDLDRAIRNRIPYGMAAEDINSSNTKILGKNLVIDGDTTVTGNIGASRATFFDMGTERMVAKNATIDQATITGVIDAPHARIRRASLENVTITGTLDGVKGRFIGTVLANQIEGSQIYGLTFDTGFSGGYRINMERQVLRFYEDGNVKMTIGFRDGNDNPLYEPFIRMGKGKSDGSSVFYVEKNEDDITMSYRASSGYSYLKMVHGGNVDLTAIGDYAYLNASYKVVANTTFEAPTINQTSTVKAKQNIRKYEGDAIGIVMDTDIFNYHFKRDLEKGIYDNEQVGFLAESSPMLKMDDSISLNKAVAYNWKATQQQQDIIDRLSKRVDDLESMMEVI